MDKNLKEELLSELDRVRFGEIKVVLNETADFVDLLTTQRRRFYKKSKKKYDKSDVRHEG